jgi:GR25 family glycosyltransferase involved in LPS biosynthesis
MNNPFEFFEEIWCINLDHRIDRWEHAQKQFEKIGINNVQRFSAIKNDDGRIGLIKSFLELFKYAKNKNLNNILIFEDDVLFLNDTINILEKSLNQLKQSKMSWGMFYLGANTHTKLPKINNNLCLLKNAYAAHAICYHARVFDDIINKFSKIEKILSQDDINDVFFSTLQNKYNCFVTYPLLATQIPSYSDLEKKDVNYSFIEERFKNNTK